MKVAYFVIPVSLPPNIFKSSPVSGPNSKQIMKKKQRRKTCPSMEKSEDFAGFVVLGRYDVSYRFSPRYEFIYHVRTYLVGWWGRHRHPLHIGICL